MRFNRSHCADFIFPILIFRESPLKTQWSITCSSLDTPDLNLPLKAITQPENLIKLRGGWIRDAIVLLTMHTCRGGYDSFYNQNCLEYCRTTTTTLTAYSYQSIHFTYFIQTYPNIMSLSPVLIRRVPD